MPADIIPRIIHRSWSGPDPMPAEHRRYGATWQRHHPDWEMRLWTQQDEAQLECDEVLERARTPAERSDVLRYEILRRHGGVYIDTDLECLRPIDPLLEGVNAFAAYLRPDRPKIGTAIMGCEPGHPAFERAAELVRDWVGVSRPGATGPWLMTEVVGEFPDVTVFDAELFYPYHWTELSRRDDEFPDAYAVHHWSLPYYLKKVEYRYHESLAERDRVEAKNRVLKRRLTHALLELENRATQHKEAGARLKAIEQTRWWRSRMVLARTVRRLRTTAASNGGLIRHPYPHQNSSDAHRPDQALEGRSRQPAVSDDPYRLKPR